MFSKLKDKAKQLAENKHLHDVKDKGAELLEQQLPKIKRLIAERIGPGIRNVVEDDEMLTNAFGHVYELFMQDHRILQRVIKRERFIGFCLKNRDRLITRHDNRRMLKASEQIQINDRLLEAAPEEDTTMQPDNDSALDHYNRAARARRVDNFIGAVGEFDACLCSSPHALLEALAWFNLAEIIYLNFDFANRPANTISDEEYYWGLRAAEANLRAIEALEHASEAGVTASEEIVRDAQTAYGKAESLGHFFANYDLFVVRDGQREYRPDTVFRSLRLSPLRCLADWEENARQEAANKLN